MMIVLDHRDVKNHQKIDFILIIASKIKAESGMQGVSPAATTGISQRLVLSLLSLTAVPPATLCPAATVPPTAVTPAAAVSAAATAKYLLFLLLQVLLLLYLLLLHRKR